MTQPIIASSRTYNVHIYNLCKHTCIHLYLISLTEFVDGGLEIPEKNGLFNSNRMHLLFVPL